MFFKQSFSGRVENRRYTAIRHFSFSRSIIFIIYEFYDL